MANQDTPLTLAFSISVGGDFVGKQEFEQDMVTIGKGSTAVLQIQDDQLADLHAAVQLGDDGEITVLDLGSETGTLLNGSPVNNDKIAATDVVVCNHGSAGTAGSYLVQANSIAAGSFKITVANVSAGSLGEAIVVNFVALKGASS